MLQNISFYRNFILVKEYLSKCILMDTGRLLLHLQMHKKNI